MSNPIPTSTSWTPAAYLLTMSIDTAKAAPVDAAFHQRAAECHTRFLYVAEQGSMLCKAGRRTTLPKMGKP